MAITKDLSFGSRIVLVLGQTSLGPVHTSLLDGTLSYWLTQTKEKEVEKPGGRELSEMVEGGKVRKWATVAKQLVVHQERIRRGAWEENKLKEKLSMSNQKMEKI